MILRPENRKQKKDYSARAKAADRLAKLERMKRRGGCDISRLDAEIKNLRKSYNLPLTMQ